MQFERELVEITDPELPIKTRIVINSNEKLMSTPHFHNEIELIYVLKGEMTFQIGEEKIIVNKDNILFINSTIVHSSDVTTSEDTEMYLLQFEPAVVYNPVFFSEYKYLTPFLQSEQLKYCMFNRHDHGDFHELSNLLISILNEFQTKMMAYEISAKSMLYRILTILYRNNTLDITLINHFRTQKESFLKMQKVFKWVEKHYSEKITISQACNLMNFSYHYFCRLFKNVTGKTFVEYLNFIRISVAEQLLISTDFSITQISCEVGYSDISYFNRVFKKQKGCNPTQYRDRVLKSTY